MSPGQYALIGVGQGETRLDDGRHRECDGATVNLRVPYRRGKSVDRRHRIALQRVKTPHAGDQGFLNVFLDLDGGSDMGTLLADSGTWPRSFHVALTGLVEVRSRLKQGVSVVAMCSQVSLISLEEDLKYLPRGPELLRPILSGQHPVQVCGASTCSFERMRQSLDSDAPGVLFDPGIAAMSLAKGASGVQPSATHKVASADKVCPAYFGGQMRS